MKLALKEFIEKNIHLIEKNQFVDLYEEACYKLEDENVGQLTAMLLSCDINPLYFMDKVPPSYLYGVENITDIVIPNNIKSIGLSAFDKCWDLKHVTLPPNISIDSRAFAETEIHEIIFHPNTSLGDYVFYQSSLETVIFKGTLADIEAGKLEYGMNTFENTTVWKIDCLDGDFYDTST